MKIVIGSESEDKRVIATKAFQEIHVNTEVGSVGADSGIADQPLDKVTTAKGAKTRADNARNKVQKADFWLGMEGGLHDYGEGYHLVTCACLVDRDGDEYLGWGTEIHLPNKVSEQVKSGAQFGDAIRNFAQDYDINQDLITRESPFKEAVQNAYANYLIDKGNLEYRRKVGAIIFNNDMAFLIVQLVDYGDDEWNYPGGGIEKGETDELAMVRELNEELGTDSFNFIEKSDITNRYDFPDYVLVRGLKKGVLYKGQEAHLFIVKFTGNNQEIKLQEDEIKRCKWVIYSDLQSHLVFPNQWEIVSKAINSSNKLRLLLGIQSGS